MRHFLLFSLLSLPLLVPVTTDAASGGPDAHGYTWADSSSGVPFEWIDPAGHSEILADPVPRFGDVTLDVPWGGIYGDPVQELRVSRNGYITNFLSDSGNDETNDCPLPTSPSVGGGFRIYPLHDHIELHATTGRILYQYYPASPHSLHRCGVHVITWKDVFHVGSANLFSFQTLLFDNLDILFQYGSGNPEGGLGSTTGIQNDGASIGLSISCNEKKIGEEFAILIEPPVITVTTVGDELDTPAGTFTSLREAMRDAPDGARIRIHPTLEKQTCDLSIPNGGIGSRLSSNGKSLAIEAAAHSEKFHLSSSRLLGHLSIINSGWISIDNLSFEQASASGSVYLANSSTLVACHSSWVDNRDQTEDEGGAISLRGSTGTIENFASLYRCDFLSNLAGQRGGAISVKDGSRLRAEKCRFWRNRVDAGGSGGAISLIDATAELRNCDIALNLASIGGALSVADGVDLDCIGCTFDDNRATTGGAIAFRGAGANSSALFHYSTFFNNCAAQRGGAIAETAFSPMLDLDTWHCTFYKNNADAGGGAFSLEDSTCHAAAIIMADNGDDQLLITAGGSLDGTFGDNLETGNEAAFSTSGGESLIGSMFLTDLGHFGGFVRVCMPLYFSPALDRAISGGGAPLPIDARGFPTFRDGGMTGSREYDCGAVEAGPTRTFTSGAASGISSLQDAIDQAEDGAAVAPIGVKHINLTPAGLTIPAGKTIFIDATTSQGVHIHNLAADLSDGQSLALHRIDATASGPANGISTSAGSQFTAHRCFFGGFTLHERSLLEFGGSACLLRSSVCDTQISGFSGVANIVRTTGPETQFIARDTVFSNNRPSGSMRLRIIALEGTTGIVQRCSLIGNTVRRSATPTGVLLAGPSSSAGTRAWLLCENTTISSNLVKRAAGSASTGGLVLSAGGSSSINRQGIFAEACNNTIVENRFEPSDAAGLKWGKTASSFLEISCTRNIVAGNTENASGITSITSGGDNLSDTTPSFFTAADIPNTDPLLSEIVMGKNQTLVHVPRHGSPCIDGGSSLLTPEVGCTDGRGVRRNSDGDGNSIAQIDIGAVESGRVLTVTTAAEENDGGLGLGTGDSLRECFLEALSLDEANIGFAPGLVGATIPVSGSLDVGSDDAIDINAEGAGITLEKATGGRLFGVRFGEAHLSVAGLTIDAVSPIDAEADATASFSGCHITGATVCDAAGNAVCAYLGTTFTDHDRAGGALLFTTSAAKTIVDRCVFYRNRGASGGTLLTAFREHSRCIVKRTTIAQNAAKVIDAYDGGFAYFSDSTITRNSGGFRTLPVSTSVRGPIFLRNTIAANHTGPLFRGASPDSYPYESLGGNVLDASHPNFSPATGDLTVGAAFLAPLADYDGDGLLEMPPLAASPAFNTSSGATEPPVQVITVDTADDENDTPAGANISLREAIRDIDDGGTIIFDPLMNNRTFDMGTSLNFDKSMTIDATSLPLGIDLTTRLAWTNGHRLALHGVHIRDVVSGISGGAIRCIGTGGSFVASHCSFSNNSALTGAGIYIQNGDLTLENCTFSANNATSSSIHMPNTNARIEFCTFGDGIGGSSAAAAAIVGAGSAPGTVLDLYACVFFDNYWSDGTTPAASLYGIAALNSLGYNMFPDSPIGAVAEDDTNIANFGDRFLAFDDYTYGTAWVPTYETLAAVGRPQDFTPALTPDDMPPPEHDARGLLRIHGVSADAGAHEWASELTDTDGDGLPDWWERRYRFDPDTTNDPSADDDLDGTTLLDEFIWRTDPHDAASFPLTNLSGSVKLTFNTIPGYTYRVQSSENLINWNDEITFQATDFSDSFQGAVGETRHFLRLLRLR